jgi:hypothetical protein
VEALRGQEKPRQREQEPVARQHEPVPDPLGQAPAPRPGRASLVVQGGPGAFHQVAERHGRGAGRLAPPALHALLHVALEGGVERRPAELDRLHRRDTATG